MRALRAILLAMDVEETLKWRKPCYTAKGGNIVIMQPFQDHLSLMFFKGALLDDPAEILRSQGENSRSAMRIEFTDEDEVRDLASTLREYVRRAIAVEEAGLSVPARPADDIGDVPEALSERLAADAEYRNAFEALTPGRQRSYVLHISDAKKPETRERRVEKCRDKVLSGKGFNER
jgi:uncharacterized protein YdeI (YjbR/CyaY-like superfamily)